MPHEASRGGVTLARSQPVNSWGQPSVDAVKKRMRAKDVAYGQMPARSAGQLRMLRGRQK